MEGRKIKEELDALRLAVAGLEAEVQGLRGAAARASATMTTGGDDRRAGYDPWVKTYEGAKTQEMIFRFKIRREGSYVYCYLGDGYVLNVDGRYVTLDYNERVYRDGVYYHKVLVDANAGLLWLNISKGTGGYTAAFGNAKDQSAKWGIIIGSYPAQNAGAGPENCVMGALVLNSGADSGSGTTTVDLVTNVEYSESTRKLTQTKKTVTVASATDPVNATTDVFQATPHSNEHQAN